MKYIKEIYNKKKRIKLKVKKFTKKIKVYQIKSTDQNKKIANLLIQRINSLNINYSIFEFRIKLIKILKYIINGCFKLY